MGIPDGVIIATGGGVGGMSVGNGSVVGGMVGRVDDSFAGLSEVRLHAVSKLANRHNITIDLVPIRVSDIVILNAMIDFRQI